MSLPQDEALVHAGVPVLFVQVCVHAAYDYEPRQLQDPRWNPIESDDTVPYVTDTK